MMHSKVFGVLFTVSLVISTAQARLVQILHTNDTHSFMDGGTHQAESGGSARLKSMIDQYKADADKNGIKNLVLDAGDFLEGNIYYMADRGMKSFEIHNNMGYDVVTLGNHDYLMGAEELDKMLGKINLNFSFLAANVEVGPQFPNIREKIKPYKEIEIDGIKIAFLGLTTNEIWYSWSLDNSKITNPYDAAKDYEKLLKKRNNDFIIALTHLGVNKDKKLAKKTSNIDLIIGGHSHTKITKALMIKNKKNREVPIVQAGMHTEYLGRLVVDLVKGRPLKVISYELIPVNSETSDEQIKTLVDEANVDLDNLYGAEWLKEVIGNSVLESNDEDGTKKWAFFISDAMKDKVEADISIHAPPMNGENFPVGEITRRSILNSIPRVFDLDDTYGWSIYSAKIKGIWLKTLFETLASFGEPLAYSGVEIKYIKTPFGLKVGKALINGKSISPFKEYTVAFTEGIIRGALGISSKTSLILNKPIKSQFKIWQTLEEKVAYSNNLKSGVINESDKTFYDPNDESLEVDEIDE
jgi:5'-nucleotidase/UDP-sugar diphosphatase